MSSESVDDKEEVERLEKAISQLHALKERLKTDAYLVAMVEALGHVIDELCTDVCVDVHRWHRLDLLELDGQHEAANRVVDAAGYDIHGQIPEKVPKNETFNCDHCGQKVGAAKFAAHLAKCMGHGGRATRRGVGDGASSSAAAASASSGVSPVLSTSPSNPRPVAPEMGGAGGASPTKRPVSPAKLGVEPPPDDVKRPRMVPDTHIDLSGL